MFGHLRGVEQIEFFGLFDERIDYVDLAALANYRVQEVVYLFARLFAPHRSYDGLSSGRHLVNDRKIEVSVDGHRERARNRRCGHNQNVRVVTPVYQFRALKHSEPVLFVNHHQAKPGKLHAFLYERVGADHEINLPFGYLFVKFAFARGGQRPCEHLCAIRGRSHQAFYISRVLLGEYLGRHHQCDLIAALYSQAAGARPGYTARHPAPRVHRECARNRRPGVPAPAYGRYTPSTSARSSRP